MILRSLLTALALLTFAPSASIAEPLICLHQIECGPYDIILVAGQSNAASYGLTAKPELLPSNYRIAQIGRTDGYDYAIIPATEPLHSVTSRPDGIGFALPFARYYRDRYLEDGRTVLIVPTANGGKRLIGEDAYWAPGGPGYQDSVSRVQSALAANPDSRLVAILWHQGESESVPPQSPVDAYRSGLIQLLSSFRSALGGAPIILGEFTPKILSLTAYFRAINDAIHDVADLLPNAGMALSAGLTPNGVTHYTDGLDLVHFNATSQLSLGKRYFCAYERIVAPTSDLATSAYCQMFAEVE